MKIDLLSINDKWMRTLPSAVIAVILALCLSCSDADESLVPVANESGKHTPHLLGSDASPYGYYIYTPAGYSSAGPKFPLLIFMHGSGEKGNSRDFPGELRFLLINGPPNLIANGSWAPKEPMIVASMQCHDPWWDVFKVKKFTEFVMNTYQVDTNRIYLTGLSMGGYGIWDEISILGKASHITAAVPICGSGSLATERVSTAAQFPIWAFHGEIDNVVSPDFDKAMWKAINALNPKVPARLTIYPATGHDAWTKTYTRTGHDPVDADYTPFDMDIYSWMLQYSKR